ncbi:unnamed protein product, partial [Rangifer tarandus platyrhynchus]
MLPRSSGLSQGPSPSPDGGDTGEEREMPAAPHPTSRKTLHAAEHLQHSSHRHDDEPTCNAPWGPSAMFEGDLAGGWRSYVGRRQQTPAERGAPRGEFQRVCLHGSGGGGRVGYWGPTDWKTQPKLGQTQPPPGLGRRAQAPLPGLQPQLLLASAL